MKVAVFAFDGISMFQLSVPLLVFGELSRADIASGWTTVVCGTAERIATAEGLNVENIASLDSAEDADILVVPSWPSELDLTGAVVRETVQSVVNRGGTVVGLCLGAFALADAGVLDGLSATTHWRRAEELAIRAPRTQVRAEELYIDEGHVLTSAGTASALDACWHLVRREIGATAATELARHLVVAPHREGAGAIHS